jgi:hypothetical protein
MGEKTSKSSPERKNVCVGRYDGMLLLLLFEKKNASMIVARSDEI